ncbi:flavin reductase (NADPH)-like [Glandiceps talaboti]
MKIAVFGATGRTGQPLVKQLLNAGHQVVAITRNKSKMTTQHDNLQVAEADIFSDESLLPHIVASDAVMSCLGGNTLGKTSLYSDSMKAIVSAMRKANIKRLVCITSWCTTYNKEDPGPWFTEWILKPLVLRNVLANMEIMETFLMSEQCNDINYTIVRPPGLTDTSSTGQEIINEVQRQFTEGGRKRMSREDVAKFMLSVLSTAQFDRVGVAIDCV